MHLGCCISAHGFGHAARAAAVLEELARLGPLHCTIVCQVPAWFFRSTLSCSLDHLPWQADVGLVHHSALHVDLPASLSKVAGFYPLRQELVSRLAMAFADCDLVLCDIAPAGIAAARLAGIPSVLLENFTWDWIYEGYLNTCPGFLPFLAMLRELYQQADYHIQAIPVCKAGPCDLMVGPISRRVISDRTTTRRRLGVARDQHLVLISMGGIGMTGLRLDLSDDGGKTRFLVAGLDADLPSHRNVLCLPPDSDLAHQDLVAACDAVIGKVGYSTIAEVYRAHVPFGYIRREGFRESGPLEQFIRREMAGLPVSEADIAGGSLTGLIPDLLSLTPSLPRMANGAGRCAAFLAELGERHRRKG